MGQERGAIEALKGSFLQANTPLPGGPTLQPAQMLAEVALMLALPEPASVGEAQAQIAALQSGSLRLYAGTRAAWAQPIMLRVQGRMPDPAAVPSRQTSGAPWTPSTWRAYVALLLA